MTQCVTTVVATARTYGGVVPLDVEHGYVPRFSFARAMRDERALTEHYRVHPRDGVGVVADVAGLVVLDVEHPSKREGCPDGSVTLASLESELGALPTTRSHRTKSAGTHLVFTTGHSESGVIRSAQGELRGLGLPAPGLDVVAGHALLRWPPTPGYSLLLDVPIAELPVRWLAALSDPPAAPREATTTFVGDERARRYATVVLVRESAKIAALTRGRNCELTRAAFRLGQLMPAITTEEIEERLLEACEENGALKEHSERACVGTIRRAVSAGAQAPRGQRA